MLDLNHLNPAQKEAVLTTEGPLLVIAGAGSGKTRVLTYRIAHLVQDLGADPSEILAITFTNKAAQEMKERLRGLLGQQSAYMWVSTFHSFCVRVLRAHADAVGLKSTFSIYDTDDSKRLIKEIYRSLNIDDSAYPINAVIGRISNAKNELVGVDEYENNATSHIQKVTARIYRAYQERLLSVNAADFDDLLFHVATMLEKREDIRNSYSDRFRYIHVDEYQDTNRAQYQIAKLLAKNHQNIMVVGDDDQSIYSWRGADISNILNFERDYKRSKMIKLEENYRSTSTILDAANALIKNNKGRKEKTLFTSGSTGQKIGMYHASNDLDEARYVAGEIERKVSEGRYLYSDIAVFYRTNAQSRLIEDAFLRAGIPYRIVGGTKFFERAEIRDFMSYLKVLVNPADDIAYRRIINTPRRKIGPTTVAFVQEIAGRRGIPFGEAIEFALMEPDLKPAAARALGDFMQLMREMSELKGSLLAVVEIVLEKSTLKSSYEKEYSEEALSRAQNLGEFINVVAEFAKDHEDAGLADFTEWLALRTDLDAMSEGEDSVTLMTVHNSKGLEFPIVYVVGLEETIFPHENSMFEADGLEEERRLAYVAITRAREQLFLSAAASRQTFGQSKMSPISRFIDEIPEELIELKGIGSRGYSGFGQGKRGDRRAVASHGVTHSRERDPFAREASSDFADSDFDFGGGASLGSKAGGLTGLANFGKRKERESFAVGERIEHKTFGRGTITALKGDSITVEFDSIAGSKNLMIGYAPISKIQ